MLTICVTTPSICLNIITFDLMSIALIDKLPLMSFNFNHSPHTACNK